ncbi:MAG: Zn-ribbon containing protein [Asgard group archaeon]|nr:Zn-ribbon containing protein [Asgard group archaeon]
MDFICGKCNKKLEKSPLLLIKGCPYCGSKVFKTIKAPGEQQSIKIHHEKRESSDSEESLVSQYEIIPKLVKQKDEQEPSQEDVIPAIQLREKGIYDVNLDSLFQGEKADPIVLSSRQGVYRVEILPVEKKKDEKKIKKKV